jgi:hypothetical protein
MVDSLLEVGSPRSHTRTVRTTLSTLSTPATPATPATLTPLTDDHASLM